MNSKRISLAVISTRREKSLSNIMKKPTHNLITGLDIGTHFVRMAVGQIHETGNGQVELQLLGAAEVVSEGVNKGVVSSIEDVVSSVSACLERAERMVGVPIDRVWVGVSDPNIITQANKGVIVVAKANNEITEEDAARAIETARSIATPLNYEVLHVLPRGFAVDGQLGIKDPVGMTGIRLEVDTNIILGSTAQIKNLTKAIYRTGLEIDDLVLSILASAEAVLTARQKDLGVAVVNLGGSTTSMVVFEEGDILRIVTIPIGSEHITNDIAIGLRTSVDIAEKVKLEYGDCVVDGISKTETIDLFNLGSAEHEMIKKRYVSEIIEARVEEIMKKIDNELIKIQRSGLLPAGVVFIGAGSKLSGITEIAKKYLRLPASLGYSLNFASVTEKVNDIGFSTAIGLVRWGSNMAGSVRSGGRGEGRMMAGIKKAGAVQGMLRGWLKTLIP